MQRPGPGRKTIERTLWTLFLIPLGWAGPAARGQASPPADAAWQLSEALGLPEWIRVEGTHRTRYETLHHQFRQPGEGGDQILVLRTTVTGRLGGDGLAAVLEVADSRQGLADSGTPLDTGMVNTWELLQAHGVLRCGGPFLEGSTSQLRLGRQTLDLGSRRLVARNRFRNTTNAFNGVDWLWETPAGSSLRAFYLLPLERRPTAFAELRGNRTRWDRESLDLRFWGVRGETKNLLPGLTAEGYLLRLEESEGRERRLWTPGLRLYRDPSPGRWDFELEAALQQGGSRVPGTGATGSERTHRAHFHHGGLGYTFDLPGSPRLGFQYDYASGDRDPEDGESNRFDTLFGARRFEYGPSSIYGAVARSNLHSPGYRITAAPGSRLTILFSHRLLWLASATDAWTTGGLRDPDGESGSFLGNQIEARAGWEVPPGNLRVEAGGAHLFAGGFIRATAARTAGTSYGYLQISFRF